MWQDSNITSDKKFSYATNYCTNLSFNNFNNWRLPNINELTTLLYYSDPLNNYLNSFYFDTTYFTNGGNDKFWSSTININIDSEDKHWIVNFNNDNGESSSSIDETDFIGIRCVRDIDSANYDFTNSFIRDNNNQIIIDTKTSLIWQDTITFPLSVWSNAIRSDVYEGCESLSLGGYSNWRLPNINELKSIIDYSQRDPNINSIFVNNLNVKTWSSTTNSNESHAWYIDFLNGEMKSIEKINSNLYSRCVKDR